MSEPDITTVLFDASILDRMVLAVERVRQRLRRTVDALESAGVDYAIAGGHAVAAWVAGVDEAGTRNTPDIDILIRREELDLVQASLTGAGFHFATVKGIDMFLDGPGAKARDAVHILFAGEKVRSDDLAAAAAITETEVTQTDWSIPFRVVSLEPLVRMKLTSYRRKDQVHLLDLIDVGLVDASWPAKFPPELAARLQVLLDNPDG